ncbi:hypothetical protein JJD41_13215 [Oxynema sp. CENA135]|uniref:hypothetical protein n=1 Tax=Oxynema sp. CENA135 TaxID=984206 RepID=UPI00190B2278|nr:hypothetical protein [Oxynema sp. CENA135]MBK4730816.1 hypothetical protein [Oxynema sp. CENA135]
MKNTLIFGIAQLFIAILLSGCNFNGILSSGENQVNTDVSDEHELSFSNFALEICGDLLPKDSQAYPITVHRVYVKDYSKFNLIKSEVCKNAVSPKSSAGNRIPEIYHVVYFTDLERANQMAELIQRDFGTASVEIPITIKKKPPSFSSVAEASQLINSEQFSEFINFLEQNPKNIELNAIVPTYIPPGFKINDLVFTINDSHIYYRVSYGNSLGSCFKVSGTSMRGGAGVGDIETLEVYAPALGDVTIMYAKSDRENQPPWMSIEPIQKSGIIPTKILYSFGSVLKQENPGCTTTLSMNEAAKVVESLQYLNHPLRRGDFGLSGTTSGENPTQ